MMTTKKTSTGQFDVLWNGQPTKYRIYNGSLGLSGRDTENVYGIAWPNNHRVVGSLASCKKLVRQWLELAERKAAAAAA